MSAASPATSATSMPAITGHTVSASAATAGRTAPPASLEDLVAPTDTFARRHTGPDAAERAAMLAALGFPTLDALIDATVPADIRRRAPLALPSPAGEAAALDELRGIASQNKVFKNFIGAGYHDTHTPPVILRSLFENPGWYTAYTPYQAEISQGRLEALLNFQTMITDLTGLDIANASLLDEGTAAAEAMTLCLRASPAAHAAPAFFVSDRCHPQTLDIVRTRALPLGITVVTGDHRAFDPTSAPGLFGVLVQYPDTAGNLHDFAPFFEKARAAGALCVVAADLLALTLLRPPGEFGADVAVGSAQRFGVPPGFGGPHAGYFATRDALKRQMPGRLVGVSRDAQGRPALRLALGTREQHIRRDKATSNICTAQVLLAVMAAMYAVYHGPDGLRRIACRVKLLTETLAAGLRPLGVTLNATAASPVFDTLTVGNVSAARVHAAAEARKINLRPVDAHTVGITLDETTTLADVRTLLALFSESAALPSGPSATAAIEAAAAFPAPHARASGFLAAPVFNRCHTEHEMLRYLRRLEAKDLALNHSMISLGSCTMKLNAASEMLPVSWPEFARIHPFAPAEQARGYARVIRELEAWLCEITGFAAVSLQPNAGSQGEYAGLLAIRAWHAANAARTTGQATGNHSENAKPETPNSELPRTAAPAAVRDICLIPTSAHGTNPASAVMAGLKVVAVACDARGNIDVADLRAKAAAHADRLAALMVTYPSTHGVFESSIREICDVIHAHGGQVYMDGANLNAQVGLTSPALIGADVCHLNLHKTFAIPHGGGGPGVGPVCVARHLAPFLPGHPLVAPRHGLHGIGSVDTPSAPPPPSPAHPLPSAFPPPHATTAFSAILGGSPALTPEITGAVSAAPWGSASVLVIPWMFIRMMGGAGLTDATKVAILNANYIAHRLDPYFPVLYRSDNGRVAHECIIDLRGWKKHGVEAEDVAKRLMDYGYHAPTLSFPVPGTLMIEPTESETQAELDRFCDALISIHGEMQAVANGEADKLDNPLKNAPHTAAVVCADEWTHAYTREQAAFPGAFAREAKFWPAVGRVDNVHGDRHLVCSCVGMEAYS
ncbi:glycine dehydrogenase [Opitutaceae bacterium TAV5]|nr:glycine dehydrogenase [Opitutaceae bacterium TAV5]